MSSMLSKGQLHFCGKLQRSELGLRNPGALDAELTAPNRDQSNSWRIHAVLGGALLQRPASTQTRTHSAHMGKLAALKTFLFLRGFIQTKEIGFTQNANYILKLILRNTGISLSYTSFVQEVKPPGSLVFN